MSDELLPEAALYVDIEDGTAGQCVLSLWRWLVYSSLMGTEDYTNLTEWVRSNFEDCVSKGMLFEFVEDLKRHALAKGANLSTELRGELSAGRVIVGKALPETDRNRLLRLARDLYSEYVRLDAIDLGNPKPNKSERMPTLRNHDRDKWVAAQRAKKPPTEWDEIYDDVARMAAKRGWNVPSDVKGLQEAHRRYLKRQRKEAGERAKKTTSTPRRG